MGITNKEEDNKGATYKIAELRINPGFVPKKHISDLDKRMLPTYNHDVMLLKTAEEVKYTGKIHIDLP